MNTHHQHHETPDETVPPELGDLDRGLSALGAAERGSAPAGLADRIARATASDLAQPAIAGRIGFGRALGFGLAAAITLVAIPAVAIGLWRGGQGTTPSSPDATVATAETRQLEEDIGTLIYVASLFEDDGWSGAVAGVSERTDELSASVNDPWDEVGSWADLLDDTEGGAS